MPVVSTTYYVGTYQENGHSISLGADNTTGSWPMIPVPNGGSGNTKYYIKGDLGYTGDTYRYGPSANIGTNGAHLYYQSGTQCTAGAVVRTSYPVISGTRALTIATSAGGTTTQPSLGASSSTPVFSTADVVAHPSVYTAVAGDGTPNTGTLLSRGNAAATWVKWSWLSTQIESGSPGAYATGSTEKTVVLTLKAGAADVTATANFDVQPNPASLWRPNDGNVVIHLLDSNLTETASSLNYLGTGSGSTWADLRAAWFSSFTCASGAATRNWHKTVAESSTDNFKAGVYLLNVATQGATFSVVPAAGKRVYAWKLETGGTLYDKGTADSALITGFDATCKIHLYLTSATPNPRIVYDGFASTGGGVLPANQNVLVANTPYGVGSVWISGGTNTAATVTLSPSAWQTKTLGQLRSVIVDGTTTNLSNVAGTAATITSSAVPYSVAHVAFEQTMQATTGVLTATLVVDTALTPVPSLSLKVSQDGNLLSTLTASGTVGYYPDALPLTLAPVVNWNGANQSDYVLRIVPGENYTEDVIGTDNATLVATGATRAVTIRLAQVVNIGDLAAVDINLSRTVGIGTQIATSAGPVTQCAAGSVSVTMPANRSSANPLTVECSAAKGYSLKSLQVVSATDGTKSYYSGAAPNTPTPVYLSIPRSDTGVTIRVILVLAADIVGSPTIAPMLPDDLGKFSAAVTSVGGHDDFRVGDSVSLSVTPVVVGGSPITGAAIGSPTFNDVVISPTRTGASIVAVVTLAPVENTFKVPVYVTFETSTSPSGAGTPTVTTAWDVTDTITVDDVVYRRIGSAFTVTAPLTSSTYTVISARISQRVIAAGTAQYSEVKVLLPTVASSTTRTFTGTLRGQTQCTVVYSVGALDPKMAFAAYDYKTGAYLTQGVRPTIKTSAIAPAVLSDNLLASPGWPGGEPTGFTDAAFLVQQATGMLLPQVSIYVSSSVPARLEVWNGTIWMPYTEAVATLDVAFTFFRATVGDAPADLVDVAFEAAVDASGTVIPGCRVYATSGSTYDGSFVLPDTGSIIMKARARAVLYARVSPPYGYIVTGWFVKAYGAAGAGVLQEKGASLSLVAPDTGLTLKPQLAVRTVAAMTVMAMNADPNLTDEGIWVSKLFRAQFPWKPLTANVVARPAQRVTLGVMKDGDGSAPTELNIDNPGTVSIEVTGDGMRRLPPGKIQKTRFVRYMVLAQGAVSISSVAIGSGAETMKGGH